MVSLPEGIELVSFLRSGDSVLVYAGAPPGSLFSRSDPCLSRIHQNGMVLFTLRNFAFAGVEVVKVLFLNRVYPPADGATGQLLADLAAELAKLGWQVTVVTSATGRATPWSQTAQGVRVERVGTLAFSRASHLRRALSYLPLYPAFLCRAPRLPPRPVRAT